MSRADRAPGALLFAMVAVGLVAFSATMPWFTADFSSGRKTPAQGMQSSNQTGIERATFADTPYATTGDAKPAQPETHDTLVKTMGWLVVAGAVGAFVVVLAEIPGIRRILPRPVSITAGTIAVVSLTSAAVVAWFFLPASFGIGDGPFTSVRQADGYWRTTLGFGWAAAVLAIPFLFAAMASKYQAGSHDPAAVVDVARRA